MYTPNADITTAKLLSNYVISTQNTKFMGVDLNDVYLNMTMSIYEYTRIPITMIPHEIIEE